MKKFKLIISYMLLLAFGVSAAFNILFLANKANRSLSQTGFIIVTAAAFVVSLAGYILKIVRKEDVFAVNIITPVKELGVIYTGALITWAVTYFLAILNR